MGFHGALVDDNEYMGQAADHIFHKVLAEYTGGASFGNWTEKAGAKDVNKVKAADFYKLYQDTNGKYGWDKEKLHAMARCGYIFPQEYKNITGEDYEDGRG